jgi:hypothetical protein
MTVQQLRHKAGDTLTWPCSRADAAGDPVAVASVEACFETLGALTANVTDAAGGLFTLSATAEATALWTPGVYRGDVTLIGAGSVSTETFVVVVETGYDC